MPSSSDTSPDRVPFSLTLAFADKPPISILDSETEPAVNSFAASLVYVFTFAPVSTAIIRRVAFRIFRLFCRNTADNALFCTDTSSVVLFLDTFFAESALLALLRAPVMLYLLGSAFAL